MWTNALGMDTDIYSDMDMDMDVDMDMDTVIDKELDTYTRHEHRRLNCSRIFLLKQNNSGKKH
jgi:hypothetical protein